jgi:D-inositol-3-phosphate glycosyltransferase
VYSQGRNSPPEAPVPRGIRAALLTGCQDRPYAFGLAMALVSKGICLDVIGSDDIDSPELHRTPNLRFVNLMRGRRKSPSPMIRLLSLLAYYWRLIRYTATAEPKILHILWNSRLELFDRTALMLYFRALGKRIVITAHNVNQGRRDSSDSLLNRLTLKIQYRLCGHIFVHTEKMKRELCVDFGVRAEAVTVIRHPINNAFPDTELTPAQAKQRLDIRNGEKTILFFGRLRPYKGVEYLLEAYERVSARGLDCRLILAGEAKKGSEEYFEDIQRRISGHANRDRIIQKFEFIPDKETELYLKAADVLVLPYKEIFQSGVLFLAYSFGLPVVAADVGSFREEIVEGKTGFISRSCEPADLANALELYFQSDLYKGLDSHRGEIRAYAYAQHSWEAVAELTRNGYEGLIDRTRP